LAMASLGASLICLVFLISIVAAAPGVYLSGLQFFKDGAAFTPRGFNSVGALTPPGCSNGGGLTAATHFTAAELALMKSKWKANTIRLQVSQSAMDPSNTKYTATQHTAYLHSVLTKVQLARQAGLVVVVSMQDQSIGCGPASPMPSSATTRAWQKLTPYLKNNSYVLLELFNEPQNTETASGWANWLSGGVKMTPAAGDTWAAYTSVGHQSLVNLVRSLGAKNALLVDGARLGEHMEGVPLLKDPLGHNNIGYAIHPYYYEADVAHKSWDSRFGYLTAKVPVLATEWNYQAADCGTKKETRAPEFLTYLKSKGIGVLGHALDQGVGQNLMADWNLTPTQCGTAHGGGGQAFLSYMTSFTTALKAETSTDSSSAGHHVQAWYVVVPVVVVAVVVAVVVLVAVVVIRRRQQQQQQTRLAELRTSLTSADA